MRPVVVGLILIGVVVGVGIAPVGSVGAQPMVTVTVTVETPDGTRVPDVQLTATWDGGSSEATTAANGKAFIDVERGANVTIEVDHPDYVRNRPVTLNNAKEQAIDIAVHPRASARLRVTDSDGPVKGVLVTFRTGGELITRETTDADGVLEVGPLAAGEYIVTLRKSRYLQKQLSLQLSGTVRSDVTIQRGAATLTFNVTDDYFSPSRPIEDATIQVADVGSVKTQANGIQQISVPVNTRQTIRISKEGYQAVDQEIAVGETDRRIRVHLRRTPSLSIETFNDRVVVDEGVLVEVTDEYGEAVTNATIRVDGTTVGTTNADGRVTVPIRSAGEHELVAASDGLTSPPVTVQGIQPGGTEASPTTTPTTTGPGLHGFGVGLAVVGLLLAVLLGWDRRR